jgi:hypothetical protein
MLRLPLGWATRRAIVLVLTGMLAVAVVGAVPVCADGPGTLQRTALGSTP